MTSQKHILIVSYVFPPYPGIGGRRWAKFARCLAERGYIVHVISSKNPFKESSLYLKDSLHQNIIIHELPSSFPAVLIKGGNSLFDKIWYKVSLNILKLFTNGNYYDRGLFWRNKIQKVVEEIIKEHDIKNVVVSGAPFSLLYFVSLLRPKYPDVNFIGDLRDPWTWGAGYGMQTLSLKRKMFEGTMERTVVERFDTIFVPVAEMQEYMQKKYADFSEKIILLPHGYDESEIIIKRKERADKKRWVFYGTIYPEIEIAFKKLASVISCYKNQITLDIYTSGKRFSAYFQDYNLLGNQVNYYEPVPPDVLFGKFNKYDNVVIIQPDFAKDYITTKIYEIIYSETPIILISSHGKLSDLIINYRLGIHITPSELNETLTLEDLTINNISPHQFPISDYSFNAITRLLISRFK